jgi:hemolysin III
MTTLSNNNVLRDTKQHTTGPFRPKDPVSAYTHFGGFLASILAMPFLLIHAAKYGASTGSLISLMVFMMSMILLYGASASYHSFHISQKVDMVLKRVDHMSIFALIAGSYTPICVIALKGQSAGTLLLTVVWVMAAAGMLFKLFWVTCPKWVSSVIYTGMGWACLIVMPQVIAALQGGAFNWLLAGGILYTIGAVIYCLKPAILDRPGFGNHELFHCFVLAGSICHFIVMYQYIAMMG